MTVEMEVNTKLTLKEFWKGANLHESWVGIHDSKTLS